MRMRAWSLLALVLLAPLTRAEEKTKAPTFSVRLQGIDTLVSDLQFLTEQAGRGEELKQVEGLLKAAIGDKGLEGLDTKKPMALHAYLDASLVDSQVILMLPIADSKAFVDTLDRLGVKPTKDKNDLYEVQLQGSPFPAYFRFANGYMYGTLKEKKNLDVKALPKPADVFPAADKDLLTLSMNLEEFPEDLRKLILGQLELQLTNLKEKQPGETKAQHVFRAAAMDEVVGFLKSLMTDSAKANFRFGVDRKANEMALSLSLSGKEGSELAKSLAGLGKTESSVAGIVGDDSAIASRVTFELPNKLKKDLAPVIDEAMDKILEKNSQQGVKELLEPILKAAAPTLKQARLDFAFDYRGPTEKKLYTAVGALGIKDGAALEKALINAHEKVPAEAKDKISLGVAKVGGTSIHRLNVEKDLDEEARKQFGESPVWFAIRDDAVFVALGDGGLAALKDALSVKRKNSPVMHLEMGLSRVAALMTRDNPGAEEAAKEAFKKPGTDKITVSLTGGEELKLKMSMKGPVLRFFVLLEEAKKKSN